MNLPPKKINEYVGRQLKDNATIINQNTTIEGNLIAKHEIIVLGSVKGDMTAAKITIEDSANCFGSITSEHVKIAGKFNGEINARKVEIIASANVKGNIRQKLISVEAGAILDAEIKTQH